MSETNFFWEPLSDDILQERNEAGVAIAAYLAEPGLHGSVISQYREGVESQMHCDGQGSTIACTDENQNITGTQAYSAFGELTQSTGSFDGISFQFYARAGFIRIASTSDYAVRRGIYEPRMGRWMSTGANGSTLPLNAGWVQQGSWQSRRKWDDDWAKGINRHGGWSGPRYSYGQWGRAYPPSEYEWVPNPPGAGIGGRYVRRPQPAAQSQSGQMPELTDEMKLEFKDCKCEARRITGVQPGVKGLVFCENDRFIALANPAIAPLFPDQVKCLYFPNCTRYHEQTHIKQYQFACPDACKGKPCGKDKKAPEFFLFQIGWTTDACSRTAECYAHAASIDCIIGIMEFHRTEATRNERAFAECVPVGKTALLEELRILEEIFKCKPEFLAKVRRTVEEAARK